MVISKCNIKWLQSLQNEINLNFEEIQKLTRGTLKSDRQSKSVDRKDKEFQDNRETCSEKAPDLLSMLSDEKSNHSVQAECNSVKGNKGRKENELTKKYQKLKKL